MKIVPMMTSNIYKFRPTRILLIAHFESTPGREITEFLESFPEVELTRFDLKTHGRVAREFKEPGDYPWGKGVRKSTVFELKEKELFDETGPKFDLILHVQNGYFPQNTFLNMPYLYMVMDIANCRIPTAAQMILCPTQEIFETITILYPGRSQYLLPYCYYPPADNKLDFENRPVLCSFAGDLHNFEKLYAERRHVVKYCMDHIKGFEAHCRAATVVSDKDGVEVTTEYPQIGNGHLTKYDYLELMGQSRFVLNVPTEYGLNFRDLEALANGAILLTKRTRDSDLIGLEHGVNCLFYESAEEIPALIEAHKEDIALAQRGNELIMKPHKLYMAAEGAGVILHVGIETEQNFREAFLEFQREHSQIDDNVLKILRNIESRGMVRNIQMVPEGFAFEAITDAGFQEVSDKIGLMVMNYQGHTLYDQFKLIDDRILKPQFFFTILKGVEIHGHEID